MDRILYIHMMKTHPSEDEIRAKHNLEIQTAEECGMCVDVAYISEHDKQGFIDGCKGYRIVLCAGNPPLDRETAENTPDVEVFIRYGIGINTIDMEACAENGKLVYFMPGYCKEELALHAMSMILDLLRNTSLYDRKMRQGMFPKAQGPLPRRLGNLTVGLFGMGGSARELARILIHGFGSKVIAYDPYIAADEALRCEVTMVDFDQLLAQSDIISLHAPLTEETHHIFNRDVFEKMKPDSMIINVARGPLIDPDDLYDALRNGTIGFAGLDVYEYEPTDGSLPLLSLDNVVLTPHSAFHGKESTAEQYRLASMFIRNYAERKLCMRYIGNRSVVNLLKRNGFQEA